ncbi:hypothetical protein [Allorhodopirellula heiligendammensis]|uniref:hypothetical protein n=1 Tax=Allorhodopirellula heiligendammensis TaxID=2714739 RepID=UPI0011B3AC46|nr:hypothetical protein [Allorhodopirellula heiligendammensis]
MNAQRQRQPFCVRLAIVSAATGIVGWLTWSFGSSFVEPGTHARLHDLLPAIGSSIMSVCSSMFMLVAVVTVIDCVRNETFNRKHAIVLVVAACITLAAGVDGAYPR